MIGPLSISAFAHALRSFQSGEFTPDELSWEIDRQLAIEKASPAVLLEILNVHQAASPLPSELHAALVQRLEDWPRDPTIVTGERREPRVDEPAPPGVGDILQGRFSLVALVGQGGMSRVFKAIDLRRVEAGATDPYVAVKVLTEPFNDYFGSIVALQREAHKLQSLGHPNIVRVIDCDRQDHTVFMTMEFLAGESLQKRLRARAPSPFEPAEALAVVTAVGEALEYAHQNHIVHGDLKPGNIIVTHDAVVKVIDFGMARFIGPPAGGAFGAPGGTPPPKAVTVRYASPEMVAGHEPEPADDVYALACIAYEVMSGTHPFGRQSDPRARDPKALLPRPRGMQRHQYAALVDALAFDRRNRIPSVRQFLDRFLETKRKIPTARWATIAGLALAGVAASVALLASRPHPAAVVAPRPPPAVAAVAAVAPRDNSIHDCPTCPVMRMLPSGRFMQGNDGDATGASSFEKPAHRVVVGAPFAMSVNDVTVGNFLEFATATKRDLTGCNVYTGAWHYDKAASWRAPGFTQDATHPVTCVSWDDAVAYAKWLSALSGHAYRLPSASEWEYAARAGSASIHPWLNDTAAACRYADVADASAARRFPGWTAFPCDDHFVNTAPVGSFEANAFGLYDMLGNVFEWVQDCWHDDYTGAPSDGSARSDGSCAEHELRGGSWFTSPRYVSITYRNRFSPSYRSSTTGFRLVRDAGQ